MALIVQTAPPTISANGYISVADFRSYQAARGRAVTTYSDEEIEQAIIRATDYIDFAYVFNGNPTNDQQLTQFPRNGEPLPLVILKATQELGYRALSSSLEPQGVEGGAIIEKTEVIGKLQETTKYSEGVIVDSEQRFYLIDKLLSNSGLLAVDVAQQDGSVSYVVSTSTVRT